jgi:L-prolyl-PCP dehydrogenase
MFERNASQQMWREKIIDFAASHINPGALEREQTATFNRQLWLACGQLGLTGLSIPPEWGGQGMDAYSTVLALEALGFGSEDPGLNFGIAAHLLAVAVPLWKYGTEEQRQRFLPGLCNGQAVGGNAITEETAGSDVFAMQTTGILLGDHYHLNGTKTYCSNGGEADTVLTYAMTNPAKGFFGGISAFVLEAGQQKISWSETREKLGLRTCPLAALLLKDSVVPVANRLGQEGAGGQIFNASMTWERICLGAIHLGAMDRLLKLATQFANHRFSGGQNLSARQAVTHPLADLKVRLEGARLLTYQAAQQLDAGQRTGLAASMAKLAVSECYKHFCLQMMQLFAGEAYQTPHPVEIQLRAALGATLYSGTSEIHRNLVAREIGFKSALI